MGQSPATLQPAETAGLDLAAGVYPINPLQSYALHADALAARIREDEAACKRLWQLGRKLTWGYEQERRWSDDAKAPEGREGDAAAELSTAPDAREPMVLAATPTGMTTETNIGENLVDSKKEGLENRQPFWTGTAATAAGRLLRGNVGGSGSGGSGNVGQRNRKQENPERGVIIAPTDSRSPLLKTTRALGSRSVRRPSTASLDTEADYAASGLSEFATARGQWGPLAGLHQHSSRSLAASVDSSRLGEEVELSEMCSTRSRYLTDSRGAGVIPGNALKSGEAIEAGDTAPDVGVEAREQPSPTGGDEEVTLDLMEHLWGACRLQYLAIYPLIFPVTSPPLKGWSGRGSRKEDDDTDGSVHPFRSPKEGHFSGPWGGNFTMEDGRSWGRWDALGPFPRRHFGSGGMGSINEMDPLGRQRVWSSSSCSSPVAAHYNSSVGGGVRSDTPDYSGGHGGVGFLSREKHGMQVSEPFAETTRARTRSANSRESIEDSCESEERSERSMTIAGRLHHGEAAHRGGSKASSASLGMAPDAAGELRQTRSISVVARRREVTVELGGESGWSSHLRRRSSALDDLAMDASQGGAGLKTAEERPREPLSSAHETEAVPEEENALTFAKYFVDAYCAYLIECRGFKVVPPGRMSAPLDTARMGPGWTRRDSETPSSSPFVGHGGSNGSSGVGRRGDGRYDCTSSTSSHHSGHGGPTLARTVLRLGLPMTNTVVLVEVAVRGDWEGVGVRAAAMNPRVAAVPAVVGGAHHVPQHAPYHHPHHHPQQPFLTETMTASIKMWTLDVDPYLTAGSERGNGESAGVRGGDSDGDGVEDGAYMAVLPTLRTFKWASGAAANGLTRLRRECLPDELPRQLADTQSSLRFRGFVTDFIVVQVGAGNTYCVFFYAPGLVGVGVCSYETWKC